MDSFYLIFLELLTNGLWGWVGEGGGGGGVWGGGAGGFLGPQPKICYTYPAMMKPGTLIPHLKKYKKS